MTWTEYEQRMMLHRLAEQAALVEKAIANWEAEVEIMAQGEQSMRQQGATEAEVAVYLHEYDNAMRNHYRSAMQE